MPMRSFLTSCCLFALFSLQAQSYVPERNNAMVKMGSRIPVRAYSFPLSDVELLSGPFRHAFSLDSGYLLSLVPDRLLYRFHQHAGLPVKDSIYGGWESEGLSGHTLGHYLSAMSLLYATHKDPMVKSRVDYMVRELGRCQEARKSGYIGAIPNEDSIFGKVVRGEIRTGGFDLNGGWSPWYTVHKVMAGLCDAYLYTGNVYALNVVKRMADWVHDIVDPLPDSLRLRMLNCEYGGMNEVLANIYSFTGDQKYLDLSYKFYDEFVMGKLAAGIDPMPGKHSNTNVPKAIGSARQYELTGNERERRIAAFFWETMVKHHTYVIGGNSNYEYCGKADSLNDRLSDNTCETCNTYNMLKLTRHLFSWQPSSVLMDYYERALYNHILSSQHPASGMMCYFVPLRMGTQKQFSDSTNTFTCCVGSGMENHVKYGESIYSEGSDGSLWVNLFIASRLNWRSAGYDLELHTNFPESPQIQLKIVAAGSSPLVLHVRKPFWLKGETVFTLNGRKIDAILEENGYWRIEGRFTEGSLLEWGLPMALYTESMPDNKDRVAIKYGPLVLAGLLGSQKPDPVYGTPVLLTDVRDPGAWVSPSDRPLTFQSRGVGRPFDVTLVPFYQVYDQYYSVYWDYFTPKAWQQLQAEYEAEKKRVAALEERTIDHFRLGEMQPERDHRLSASERSYVDEALGRKGREARSGNYFSFSIKVDPARKNNLVLTYIGDDKDRAFDLLVNGQRLQTVQWPGGKTGVFYDVEYRIPDTFTTGRSAIDIRIEANQGKTAGRVFSARTVVPAE